MNIKTKPLEKLRGFFVLYFNEYFYDNFKLIVDHNR